MPELGVPKSHRQKKRTKEFKRELYHRTLFGVLRPVRQAQKQGGFWAMLKGRYFSFYFKFSSRFFS